MAGLYFHIPFCRRICAYCDFYRSAQLARVEETLRSMHLELEEQHSFLGDRDIRTVYFGGGTPSLVKPEELQRLIDHAAELFDCSSVEETTIEVNPDDVTAEYVESLRLTSIDRVSLGVQSFDDAELRFMNRRHDAATAIAAIKRLQDSGLDNITIDLIFGVDGFGEQVLLRTLEQTLSLGVKHVSAYHLTIEPSTAFGRRLERGEMREVEEECSEREYALVERLLCGAGFEHYEVSNYALEGFRSRHNSSYWRGVEYLGIGAGAHSYNGKERHWSEQALEEYIVRREYQSERLSREDRINERIMTSLRCCEGLDIEAFASDFGNESLCRVLRAARPWCRSGDVVIEGSRLRVPSSRFLISDAVIESMFEVI